MMKVLFAGCCSGVTAIKTGCLGGRRHHCKETQIVL